jgi:predicted ATP-dependent protease
MRDRCRIPSAEATIHTDPAALDGQAGDEAVPHRFALQPARVQRAFSVGVRSEFHMYLSAPDGAHLERDLAAACLDLVGPVEGSDLVYVQNFLDPFEPVVLELPPGQGPALREAVDRASRQLRRRLGSLSYSEGLRSTERDLARALEARNRETVAALEAQARDLGFGVRNVAGGIQTFPILHGKPLSSEQFTVLDEATRRTLTDAEEHLSEAVESAAGRIRELNEQTDQKRDQAMQATADALIDEELAPLRVLFEAEPAVQEFIDSLTEELVGNWRDLLELRGEELSARLRSFGVHVVLTGPVEPQKSPVDLLVDPSLQDLFGYVAWRASSGVLTADFSSVRPGALLRAGHGVLLLRAADLIRTPGLWPRLRRAMLNRAIEIDESAPPGSAATLRPRPLPLSTKIVLIGPDELHSALVAEDPDFAALFRIRVEFEQDIARTPTALVGLDRYLAQLGRERGWLPLDPGARAFILDLATRFAEDRNRLSLHTAPLEELLSLSSDEAALRGEALVQRAHVEAAWAERRQRGSGASRFALDQVLEGVVLIETDGHRVGVVNGLAVFSDGEVEFGQPMRITAVVSPGTEGLVDVEREAHLAGSVHTKGVAILRGLLSRLFGQERPLSLRAQITFEQSYGEIDGDSASSSELFAILSAIADVGIDQSIAVTGSVSQLGEMQAIGGVCAKIEGFFDLCASRGLTGSQGVMIPRSNTRHLVLRDDVTQAIAEGRFHLYAIRDVAEGIEILTGIPAGARDDAGRFPASSVYGRVERRLIELAERLRSADGPPPGPLPDEADPEGESRGFSPYGKGPG